MSSLWSLMLMALALGVGSFGIGILPLSFTFSRTTLARLSIFGTGLLIGTALGVIIPEGVATISNTHSSSIFPTRTISLSLVGGFKLMLVIERILHVRFPHGHSHNHHLPLPTSDPGRGQDDATHNPRESFPEHGQRQVEFSVELDELERAEGIATSGTRAQSPATSPRSLTYEHDREEFDSTESKRRAYPLTLGLIVHAFADGLALGSSAVSPVQNGLSAIIFLALIVHKAPTALALATSLLSTSLPRSECRKHIAAFSLSTPVGALVSYGLITLVQLNSEGNWTGVAMLVSGGTFLYVATVLQPGKAVSGELDERQQFLCLFLGIAVPAIINLVFDHDH